MKSNYIIMVDIDQMFLVRNMVTDSGNSLNRRYLLSSRFIATAIQWWVVLALLIN